MANRKKSALRKLEAAPGGEAPFPLFVPTDNLLVAGSIPIETIAELALREGQSTNPLFRVHRWFARRLSSQFRSILAGLTLERGGEDRFWERYFGEISLGDIVVLDPFVGGGTALIEAARCGARVIGFDIDPVATAITRFELATPNLDGIPEPVGQVCDAVSALVSPLHMTVLEDGTAAEVLHHFWVEVGGCPSCREEFEIHPHFQLAYDGAKKTQWVFCRGCHGIRQLPIDRKEIRCECGTRTKIQDGPLRDGKAVCPHCRSEHPLVSVVRKNDDGRWRLFAQEYLERSPKGVLRKFKRATDEDRKTYLASARKLKVLEKKNPGLIPERKIPTTGRSDGRPLIHGFHRYRELFNRRQLLHLALLGQAIAAVDDEKSRQVLGMAFSEHLATNCMYAAYAFGYRRLSPLFAVHSYRHITRPVEVNPWLSGLGRGTFPNVLAKIRKGIAYAKAPADMHPDGGRRPSANSAVPAGPVGKNPEDVIAGKIRKAIRTHSSTSLVGIPDGSVDLILTDPPYFDNVSYSEMSDFYLAWHQVLGAAEAPYDDPSRCAPMRESLAANCKQSDALEEYTRDLTTIFGELGRVLKPEGRCVFTYHHKFWGAWSALGEAMVESGLECVNVFPMRGEGQGGLHSCEGTLKWDAVLVCRKRAGERPKSGPAIVSLAAVMAAREKARDFQSRLTDPRIGFRDLDRQNLFMAMVAASARIGEKQGSDVTLREALSALNGK